MGRIQYLPGLMMDANLWDMGHGTWDRTIVPKMKSRISVSQDNSRVEPGTVRGRGMVPGGTIFCNMSQDAPHVFRNI